MLRKSMINEEVDELSSEAAANGLVDVYMKVPGIHVA